MKIIKLREGKEHSLLRRHAGIPRADADCAPAHAAFILPVFFQPPKRGIA